jgi:UDP-GlcNAc3NAcA epimerase
MRVLTVVGARPQFIKAAPVSRALRRHHEEFLLHTGQHYDDSMSEVFFRQLEIPPPDRNLGVGSGPHGAQTAAMLAGVEAVALDWRPDCVLVYGDTNSTLAAAMAAAKLRIPVAHVEAGLRSYDRRMPEEINRVVTDHLASTLLCPTVNAAANLAREGVVEGVQVVGDVMLDAFAHNREIASHSSSILLELGIDRYGYQLLTIHRAENADRPEALAAILSGVGAAGRRVVFPVHPRTRAALAEMRVPVPENVMVIDPVGYLEMLVLEENAEVIVTDSGGVQKEAYFAGRPCVTVRDRTEWTETVESGWNVVVGTDPVRIAGAMREFRPTRPRPDVFGDGHAAERIVQALSPSRVAAA